MREATRIVRAGLTAAKTGEPLHAGPVFAAPFHTVGDVAGATYSYGRSHNPTWTELERTIGMMEIDDGQEPAWVRVFGSGLAAVAAVFAAVLRPQDVVFVQAGAYFMGRQLLQEVYGPQGVAVRLVSAEQMTDPERLAGARLVWVETPSNPLAEIADVRAVAASARTAGAVLAVDNTTATPLGQRVLELGADVSVCSDSKAMCGHSDLLMGHVATRNAELLAKVDRHRTVTGGIVGPMEAWLMTRSLATLPLRLERMSENALAVAEWLVAAGVRGVLYPGLKGHPGHEVARRQMSYFGPVLGFELDGKDAAERFLAAAELVTQATSFGGIATTAERRGRWGHDDVAAGFIRMSVGCEDVRDLIEDFAQALQVARG